MDSLIDTSQDKDRVTQAKQLSKEIKNSTINTHKLIAKNRKAKTKLNVTKTQVRTLKVEKSIKSLLKEKNITPSEIKIAKIFSEINSILDSNEKTFQTLLDHHEKLARANSLFQEATLKELYELQFLKSARESEEERTLHTFVHAIDTPDKELFN